MSIIINKSAKLSTKNENNLKLYIFCGAIYECTLNVENKISTSQVFMVLDLPSQDDLSNFLKIEVLVDPAGLQDLE